MYACICCAVTEPQVHTTILAGARTVEEIGDRCGAGTSCGSCLDRLCDMLDDAAVNTSSVDHLPRTA